MMETEFDVQIRDNKLISKWKGQEHELYVYPAMWNPMNNNKIPVGAIPISDKQIITAMPYAYGIIRKAF